MAEIALALSSKLLSLTRAVVTRLGGARARATSRPIAESEPDAAFAVHELLGITLDSLSTCVGVLDGAGRILFLNRAWRLYAGPNDLIARAEVGDDYIAQCRAPTTCDATGDGDAPLAAGLISLCRAEIAEFSIDYPYRGVGDAVWFLCRAVRTPGRGAIRVVVVHEDVTDRLAAEQTLRDAFEEAQAQSRSKTEMLAHLGHELRTPLNAILGFAEMLEREPFGPLGSAKYREYVGDIRASGAHLLDLVGDVTDLGKIEAGHFELNEREIDPGALIDGCVRMMSALARRSWITLQHPIPNDLPPLHADERSVRQMVINLVSNAIKFSRPGGRVEIRAGAAPDGSFAIRVSDTGVGIAPQDIERVLIPYVRAKRTAEKEGTGLGLPLVKSLIELHGGRIEVRSHLGRGTAVTLWFPAWRTDRQGSAESAGG